MIEPINKSIVVQRCQDTAFTVFIEEMDTWLSLGKFTVSAISVAAAQTIRVEARAGGTSVEVGTQGQEHLWGMIRSYEPFSCIAMDFHIPQPNEVVVDRSLVELRFTNLEEEKTLVDLKQSNWEAFGEYAKALWRGWVEIFERSYSQACTRRNT